MPRGYLLPLSLMAFFQFEKTGCENCPFLDMAADRTRVLKCTSGSFEG